VIDGKVIVFIRMPEPKAPKAGQGADSAAAARSQAEALRTAAAAGIPFCEDCERARRAAAAQQEPST